MNRPSSLSPAVRAGVILLATVLVGCTGPQLPAGAGDVLSPYGAERVVRDYWAINERAAMHHDLNGFAQVETGLLLEADRGQVQANKALAVPPIKYPPSPLRGHHLRTSPAALPGRVPRPLGDGSGRR